MNFYMPKTIEFGPIVMESIVSKIDPSKFDLTLAPDRFTLREAVAHLADWEPIFLERMEKIKAESGVLIEGIDEGELAIKNRYQDQDLYENLALWKSRRAETAKFLRALTDEDRAKFCRRRDLPDHSLEDMGNIIVCHDMYHLEHAGLYLQD